MTETALKPDSAPRSAFGAALSSILSHKPEQIEKSLVDNKLAAQHAKERREQRANRRERKLKKELRLKEHLGDIDITTDAALERFLLKTATKGVVTLFNAVKAHQKVRAGAEPNTKKQANDIKKLSKNAFLEMLASGGAKTSVLEKEKEITAGVKRKWSALNDENLINAKAEDWNRQALSESENEIDLVEECNDYEDECDEWE